MRHWQRVHVCTRDETWIEAEVYEQPAWAVLLGALFHATVCRWWHRPTVDEWCYRLDAMRRRDLARARLEST